METRNEKIYRQVLERIILEMEYGGHDLPHGFKASIAQIINDAPLTIVHNMDKAAIGVMVDPMLNRKEGA